MGEGSYGCRETLLEIERFLDGELASDLGSLLQRHLDDCSPCMQHADFQRHLKELIGAKCGGDVVPPDLLVRIQLMIREHDSPTS